MLITQAIPHCRVESTMKMKTGLNNKMILCSQILHVVLSTYQFVSVFLQSLPPDSPPG